jgi:mannosyltransferase
VTQATVAGRPRTIATGLTGGRSIATAAALGLLALVISATDSGNASLWGDEAASIMSAQRSLPSLAMMLQHVDAVHGLYYLGLHFWIELFGASPFSVRFPSAIAAGITTAGVVIIARQLRGIRVGVMAGLVCAVLPRMTDVGSEARSYAFSAAIATWLAIVLIEVLRAPSDRRRWWIGYGALLVLGTTLFIYLLLVALAHFVIILIARRTLWREWLLTFGVVLVLSSPVLIFAVMERGQISYLATNQQYDLTALFVTPWFENPAEAIGAWVLLLGGIIIAAQLVADGRREVLIPLVWMLLPTVALLLGSTVISVYTPRYLAMCAPAVALLLAAPIEAMVASRARAEAAITFAIVVALFAPIWVSQRGPYAKNDSDWAEISATFATHARPGDGVIFDGSVRPSRRPRLALRTYPAGFTGIVDVALKSPYTRNTTWYDSTYSVAHAEEMGRFNGLDRIWLVEWADDMGTDHYGVATVQSAGFHQVAHYSTHRSVILEFVRD